MWVFITYFVAVLNQSEVGLLQGEIAGEVWSGWLQGGAPYAMYNLAIALGLLFAGTLPVFYISLANRNILVLK